MNVQELPTVDVYIVRCSEKPEHGQKCAFNISLNTCQAPHLEMSPKCFTVENIVLFSQLALEGSQINTTAKTSVVSGNSHQVCE